MGIFYNFFGEEYRVRENNISTQQKANRMLFKPLWANMVLETTQKNCGTIPYLANRLEISILILLWNKKPLLPKYRNRSGF